MENTLLIGLSRQIALQRELDVVANNIANLNTTGFKADGVGVRGISDAGRARTATSSGADRAAELRAGPRHLARLQPGPDRSRPAIRSTSRSTATASWWCRRRAASATPATARCRSTPPASWSPAKATRCSATAARSCFQPTDRDISISHGRHDHGARGRQRRLGLAARQAARSSRFDRRRSSCRRTARSTFAAPDGVAPQPATRTRASCRARSRNPTCAASIEMTRMIEVTRTYTAGRQPCCSSRATCAATRSSSSPKFRPERNGDTVMRALHTAATGMMAQELNVQVISNNIANMRTTGYKRQRAEFQDLLYEHVRRVGTQTSTRATSCRSASSSAPASRPSARRA